MKIAVGSDHAGYEDPAPHYKPTLIEFLEAQGHEVLDCGTHSPEPVDYPDYANHVCSSVLAGDADFGILICGTGIGMSMAANRHRGIRAAACTRVEEARVTRRHNDANVLCLGRRTLSLEACFEIARVFLATDFSDAERHRRRIAKMG
ncbi:MAG TPA: ribose 5-phosphate isomerase B [Candidatus Hydrogenedentes bacterium]|nr:ribose 5-phosphate isomerase B [Candidatus Hydrogenedentota bacterium]